jgi:hypothetical protein
MMASTCLSFSASGWHDDMVDISGESWAIMHADMCATLKPIIGNPVWRDNQP